MEYRIKVFVDTNVLVDYLLPDRLRHQQAVELFELILAVKIEAAFSTQSMLDAMYICRNQEKCPEEMLRRSLQCLLSCTNASYVHPSALGQALKDPSPDVEDSAHIAFAYDECCDVIITNDKNLLSREVPKPMLVMTPEAFVDKCRA